MSNVRGRLADVRLRNVGFSVGCLVGAALLVPVQLASIILFDATGWDTLVPDVVFTAIVPAGVLALVLAVAARRLYSPRQTFLVTGGLFIAYVAVTVYLTRFYMLCCGPA